MGESVVIFGKAPQLDDDFAAVLVNSSAKAVKAVAKGQAGVRAASGPGETVSAIAFDELTGELTAIVSGRRLLIMRRGGLQFERAVDVTFINAARVQSAMSGLIPVLLGMDERSVKIHFDDMHAARSFAQMVNKLVLEHRPRVVEVLYPSYFDALLSDGGVTVTASNILNLVDQTAAMIGTQAAAYCVNLGDKAAFEAFVRRFAQNFQGDERLQAADEMIDWLWTWHPACHKDLTQRFAKWRAGLLGPDSFLKRGNDIPPWPEPDRATSFAHIWWTTFNNP